MLDKVCVINAQSDRLINYSWSNITVVKPPEKNLFQKIGLRKSNKQEKVILNKVSGEAYPGEILAILGSSGSGKSTLLNALTFRSDRKVEISGTRLINGVPTDAAELIGQSAYVQQHDLFIGNLTVREHLIFQAAVRMGKGYTKEDRHKRVEELLVEFSLINCQNTFIGVPGRIKGISGGEQKRLSIASEFLLNPSLLFFDEPTSGLDSFMSFKIVQIFKDFASKNKTVILSIHQPSSQLFSLLDKTIFMAEGRVAFAGTSSEAQEFFTNVVGPCPKNYNPCDFYIQSLGIYSERAEECRAKIQKICDQFQQIYPKKKEAKIIASCLLTPPIQRQLSWFSQFRALFWRASKNVIREPLLIQMRLFQTCLVAFFISILFFGQKMDQLGITNINGAIYISIVNLTYQNCLAVINIFGSQLEVFLRENRNGLYRTDTYFLSKTLIDLPIFILSPVIFLSILYFAVGLNPGYGHLLYGYLINILFVNVATSFGYFISSVTSTLSLAMSVGPPFILVMILFGGFFLNISSVPSYLNWLSYISWFKYANEALLINQWADVEEIACKENDRTCMLSGQEVLDSYRFHKDNFFVDILALVGLIIIYRIFAYLGLLRKTYRYEK